jgi:hypothetical protein
MTSQCKWNSANPEVRGRYTALTDGRETFAMPSPFPRRPGPYKGWATRRWTRFRAWPAWLQLLAWLVGFWMLVPLYLWHRGGADFR